VETNTLIPKENSKYKNFNEEKKEQSGMQLLPLEMLNHGAQRDAAWARAGPGRKSITLTNYVHEFMYERS
jgi:hypothetical protein